MAAPASLADRAGLVRAGAGGADRAVGLELVQGPDRAPGRSAHRAQAADRRQSRRRPRPGAGDPRRRAELRQRALGPATADGQRAAAGAGDRTVAAAQGRHPHPRYPPEPAARVPAKRPRARRQLGVRQRWRRRAADVPAHLDRRRPPGIPRPGRQDRHPPGHRQPRTQARRRRAAGRSRRQGPLEEQRLHPARPRRVAAGTARHPQSLPAEPARERRRHPRPRARRAGRSVPPAQFRSAVRAQRQEPRRPVSVDRRGDPADPAVRARRSPAPRQCAVALRRLHRQGRRQRSGRQCQRRCRRQAPVPARRPGFQAPGLRRPRRLRRRRAEQGRGESTNPELAAQHARQDARARVLPDTPYHLASCARWTPT